MIQNIDFHKERFQSAYHKFYWEAPQFDLFEKIAIPIEYRTGKVKLRISYGKTLKQHSFQPYRKKNIETLKLVFDDNIDYDLKFEERSQLNSLLTLKGNCDDVLIVKKGKITDTSYANIIFWDGKDWFTPKTYLLKGTKRSQLLESEHIQEAEVRVDDLNNYKGFQLINAMLDFNPDLFLPIEFIRR